MRWQIKRGHKSAGFPLLSACRLVVDLEFDTSIICHVLVSRGGTPYNGL